MKHFRQISLFVQENALKRRFSSKEFLTLPKKPGVYFFKDERGEVLYVGKSKNLRARVSSYRHLQKGRRKLRMLAAVRSFSFETCETEEEALIKENNYLANLKPPYNRLNTYPEFYSYLVVDRVDAYTRFRISSEAEGEFVFGAFKSKKRLRFFLHSLVQTLSVIQDLPSPPYECDSFSIELAEATFLKMKSFLEGDGSELQSEIETPIDRLGKTKTFEAYRLKVNFEVLEDFYSTSILRNRRILQRSQSSQTYVPKDELNDQLVMM